MRGQPQRPAQIDREDPACMTRQDLAPAYRHDRAPGNEHGLALINRPRPHRPGQPHQHGGAADGPVDPDHEERVGS